MTQLGPAGPDGSPLGAVCIQGFADSWPPAATCPSACVGRCTPRWQVAACRARAMCREWRRGHGQPGQVETCGVLCGVLCRAVLLSGDTWGEEQ